MKKYKIKIEVTQEGRKTKFREGIMKEIIDYIEKLETDSFEGWSEDAKRGYLTACSSIKESARTLWADQRIDSLQAHGEG